MRCSNLALLVCFGGATAALLGLAWDISIHSAYPSLAQHETPLDPLSPAHDLIAAGIVIAGVGAAWAIARHVSRRLGLLAMVPMAASAAWIVSTAVAAPALAVGTSEQRAAADQLWHSTQKATERYRSVSAARADGYIAFNPGSDPSSIS